MPLMTCERVTRSAAATSAVVPVTLPAARRFARRAVHPAPLLSCGVSSSFPVSGEGVAAIARLHEASRGLIEQRSHAAHPARTRALCANGRASVTTASRCAQVGVSSQPARRRTAMPGPIGLGSLAPRAGPCLIGRRAGIRSAGHPLRFYIRPHFAKWPPVAALKLRLVSSTAARPRGFTKQALCKVSFAGSGGGVAPGHQSGAARTVGVSGLRPCILCGPPPTPPGPRRCASWAPARRLPVRPQGGSLIRRASLRWGQRRNSPFALRPSGETGKIPSCLYRESKPSAPPPARPRVSPV